MNLEFTPKHFEVKTLVAEALKEMGWWSSDQVEKYKIAFEATTWVANKDFETLAGERTATICIQQSGDELRLQGEYETEGNNVLSTTWVNIPNDADNDTIKALGKEWASKAEKTICNTRMIRLMRK
ncbi:hypothetical protein [Vibrio crassostreae]|uniref:hypothetical protein n=1 Tax=Vibrio crassostreae TaxID=246167 RepID=UPI001B3144B1|nr:hypothetical protein [Vibrio crassostreae]